MSHDSGACSKGDSIFQVDFSQVAWCLRRHHASMHSQSERQATEELAWIHAQHKHTLHA